ncbi:unnamed protein product [Sphagnum balticum]
MLPEDAVLKQSLRTRLAEERQQWERDQRLLEREYADDYDDQYDDAIGSSSSGMLATTSDAQGAADWDARMRDTKRLNQITRSDEEEVKFWKDMRNTNRDEPKQSVADSMDDTSAGKKHTGQPTNKNTTADTAMALTAVAVNIASTGAKTGSTKDIEKRHRTKTFDKHHQKDKAARKQS